MYKKTIMTVIIALSMVSVVPKVVFAYENNELGNEITRLENQDFSKEEIQELQRIYELDFKDSINRKSSNEEFSIFLDELNRQKKLVENPIDKPVISKNNKVKGAAISNVDSGDIVLVRDAAGSSVGSSGLYLGHTAIVSDNKNYVWETLGYGYSVQKYSTSKYTNNTSSPLSYLYVSGAGGNTKAGYYPTYKKGIPYGISNKWDEGKYYCSKLVWRAWMDAGYDLDVDGGYYVFPMDIYNDGNTVLYYQQ